MEQSRTENNSDGSIILLKHKAMYQHSIRDKTLSAVLWSN